MHLIWLVYEPYTNVYGFNNNAVSGAGFTFGNPDLRWEKSVKNSIYKITKIFRHSFYLKVVIQKPIMQAQNKIMNQKLLI